MKFNAGFLHSADDRAVHLNFGGGGVAEDKAGDSDLRNMYGLFFPLINPNKARSQAVTSEVSSLEPSSLFSLRLSRVAARGPA